MDKVIIDGVDVNKCGYYKDGDCLLCPVTCEEFIDCEFKEIKRLQAENERLKRENQIITGMYNSSSNRFDKLYNSLQEIREIINAPCDNCKYNKDRITCSIGDCGEGKLKIIENKINEVIGAE